MTNKITRSDIYARDEKGGEWFEDFLQSLAEQKESSTQSIIDAIQHKKSETVQGVVDKYREMVGLDSSANTDDENIVSKQAAERDKGFMSHLDPEKKYVSEMEGFLREFETGDRVPAYTEDIVCNTCNSEMPLEVCRSAAGYFIGYSCENCGPHSRKSNYFKNKEEAEEELRSYKKEDTDVSDEGVRPLSTRHAKILETGVVSKIKQDPQVEDDVRSLCEHSGGRKGTTAIINFLRGKLGKELIQYSDKDLIEYIEDTKKKYQEDIEAPSTDVGRVGIDTEDNPEDNAADYITHGKGS